MENNDLKVGQLVKIKSDGFIRKILGIRHGEALTIGADEKDGYIALDLLEPVTKEELDSLIHANKVQKLTELKEQKRDLWDSNLWSCQYFTKLDNATDDRLRDEIDKIEKQEIFCKCTECGVEDETVDFKSESPDKLICDDCWDEIREHIKDKCGLI